MSSIYKRVVEELKAQGWRHSDWPDLYRSLHGSLPLGPDATSSARVPIARAAVAAMETYGSPDPLDWHGLLTAVFEELLAMKIAFMAEEGWEQQ